MSSADGALLLPSRRLLDARKGHRRSTSRWTRMRRLSLGPLLARARATDLDSSRRAWSCRGGQPKAILRPARAAVDEFRGRAGRMCLVTVAEGPRLQETYRGSFRSAARCSREPVAKLASELIRGVRCARSPRVYVCLSWAPSRIPRIGLAAGLRAPFFFVFEGPSTFTSWSGIPRLDHEGLRPIETRIVVGDVSRAVLVGSA